MVWERNELRATPREVPRNSPELERSPNELEHTRVGRGLRAVGLEPIEWNQAVKATKKGSPYLGEILDKAFRDAAAVVVLLTPDDSAKLKKQF